MGLVGSLFGWDKGNNSLYQSFDQNRNAIGSLAGAVTGQPDTVGVLQGLAQGGMQGAQIDRENALQRAAVEKDKNAVNATVTFLQSNNPQLAALVESGAIDPASAYKIHVDEQRGAAPTANMRDFQYAQNNPGYAEFVNPRAASAPPSGYMPAPGGTGLVAIPGGPFDPANPLNSRKVNGAPMNSTIQKEIFETDEGIQAGQSVVNSLNTALELNKTAIDGPWADQRSYVGALAGNAEGKATQDLKNVVTSQALDSLKAVFGGMPTEGERKILLEIQGSVDQPRDIREKIYKRAQAAANRRIAINQQKANALRSGTYFGDGYDPSNNGAAPGNTTSGGLSWSIEP